MRNLLKSMTKCNKNGFTLIEVIISLGIIAVGVLAMMSLIFVI
ncbi:MAG: prepilin-type N-terminal cleavage/methylation domain-containing protein, partial [Bacteroidetes bacterium]|nr:prepilin-type N-terminal cleavage/methylation domain-containing protein [Bacteroidota bacterium]